MKRIIEYRKLLNVDKTADLKGLKTAYRTAMKEWHPDKFQENELKLEAEEKSKEFILAYHFLVSISPETHESALEEYTQTINTNVINYKYKGQTLEIHFSDGCVYEYFSVPKNVYNKLINSDIPGRFVRRNICNEFLYRKVTSAITE